MYAQIPPSDLIDALNPVTKLVDEAKLHVSDTGIHVRAVDPANVGMVDVQIDQDAFETLTSDDIVIGVNLTKLNQQVKDIDDEPVGDDEQVLYIELDEQNQQLSLSGSAGSMEFTMNLLNPESIRSEPDIPDLNQPGELTIMSDYFSHAIKTANRFESDQLTIAQNELHDKSRMEVTGDLNQWVAVVDENHSSVRDMSVADVESRVSLDYLDDMRKGIPSSTQIRMHIGEDFPVTLAFDYLEDNASGEYNVAPRIGDSD